jgi:hypothetical protein
MYLFTYYLPYLLSYFPSSSSLFSISLSDSLEDVDPNDSPQKKAKTGEDEIEEDEV